MNERLKELAEQAGFQYINEEGIGWAGNHNASLPKFAELIVRECNEERALELQGLVKEFFEKYLNHVEESDGGIMFSPITISCCRVMMIKPLEDLLTKMAELAGTEVRMNK